MLYPFKPGKCAVVDPVRERISVLQFVVPELPPALSPTNEDSNHTGRLLFGTFFIRVVRTRPREEKPRPSGGREGWHESERTNETMRERCGEAMTRDRKGTRGGINYRIPVRISANYPLPCPRRMKTATTQAGSCLELFYSGGADKATRGEAKTPKPKSQTRGSKEDAVADQGGGSETTTTTVKHAKLLEPLKTGRTNNAVG